MKSPYLVAWLFAMVVSAGCGGGGGGDDDGDDAPPAGPYDDVPLTQDLRLDGVLDAVHIARDEYGIPHIHATSTHDVYFGQGYVMAHDRLPQMEILRRFGAGTVAEVFGLDDGAVESDLEMRAHRWKPLAEAGWAALQASSDPTDQAMVIGLQAFSDGVNAYAADLVAGKYQLHPAIQASFDPERFVPWTPVDCLVMGKFQAFALSYTADIEVDITDIYQTAGEVFDPASDDAHLAARAGAGADLVRVKPVGAVSTIDGFPNVESNSGTRSDDLSGTARIRRPHVPRELLRAARRAMRSKLKHGPHAMIKERGGSNNWVVAPDLGGGAGMLASDPHLNLPNPAIMYPCHLVVPGELDVQGIAFSGIPGIVLGHNGRVAWGATVVFHDVNDIYLENIHACEGGGDCVTFDGHEVEVETWQEEIRIGSLGTVFDSMTVTYERVPHHGHIIPNVDGRQLIPRSSSQALSVRYTGHTVTNEFAFFWKLNRAQSVTDAFAAISSFQFGGQNFVFLDADGNIGWTTHAKVPVRAPAAYAWHAATNPDGLAPFFVLPGDGSAEWEGFVDSRYLPHAYNPPTGYLVTANSDPVGASFDGDPLNGPIVDGRPLYIGAVYATGLRTARIDQMLQERMAGGALTLDDMADIQHDARSNMGARLRPHIVAAVEAIDAGSHADVDAWIATLPGDRVQRLRDAGALLAAWQLATPPAVEGQPTAAEIADSAATSVFNAWAYYFLGRAVGDEHALLDWTPYDLPDDLSARVMVGLLEDADALQTGVALATGEALLCDDLATADDTESCTLIALQALDLALDFLTERYASPDMTAWRWGEQHRLVMEPLFPDAALNVPPPNDPNPDWRKGYPRAGDNWAVNRADCGYDDLDFAQHQSGPAQRFLARVGDDGVIEARFAFPGGAVYDPSSPHFRDIMDEYYVRDAQFDYPFATAEIVDHGEERWVLRQP